MMCLAGTAGLPGVDGMPGNNGTDGIPGLVGEPGAHGKRGKRGQLLYMNNRAHMNEQKGTRSFHRHVFIHSDRFSHYDHS